MSPFDKLKMVTETATVFDGSERGKVPLILIEATYFTMTERVHISDLKITKGKTPKDPTDFKFTLFLFKDAKWTRKNILLSMSSYAAEHFTPIAEKANAAA